MEAFSRESISVPTFNEEALRASGTSYKAEPNDLNAKRQYLQREKNTHHPFTPETP